MAKVVKRQNVVEFTVSEISTALKNVVEDRFGYVRVRGEISGFKGAHSSGHCYFTLKDDKARIEAVIWRTSMPKVRFKPEEGLEVIATGKLTTFPGASKYQIVIEALEPAGVGALMALLEERRRKLGAEGLFAESRKRALPYLPRVIGVVTSPTGAVIRDILHRLDDRFPVRVLVWPVTVQGETSATEVAAAIRGFNALVPRGKLPRPDVLIVARGGGSIEDLWSFNEEIVVRAAAESLIPLISAVGHETDWTLLDHVADRRAPTPTGAAEIAVPVRLELVAAVSGLAARISGAVSRRFDMVRREFNAADRAFPGLDDLLAIPRRTLDEMWRRLGRGLHTNAHHHRVQLERNAARLSLPRLRLLVQNSKDRLHNLASRKLRLHRAVVDRKRVEFALQADRLRLDRIEERLDAHQRRVGDIELRARRFMAQTIGGSRARVLGLEQLLRTLSYKSVLARGFALVRAGRKPVRAAGQVATGEALDLEFHDGSISAVATSGGASRRTARKVEPTSSGPQGTLF